VSPVVLDASTVAAALLQEKHAVAAQTLLTSGRELRAPDLVHAEVANVIWKRQRRREIDQAEATQLLTDFLSLPLQITPSEGLAAAALQLAMRTGRTVYDCLYLALAMESGAVMVTCDQRLVNALAGGPLEEHVVLIGGASGRPGQEH